MQPLNLFYKILLGCTTCLVSVATAGNGNIIIENSTISGGNIVIEGKQMGNATRGSGRYQSTNKNLSSYNAVVINSSFNVNYYKGKKPYAKISADHNILPLIKSTVKNNILYLSAKGSFSTSNPIEVDIFSPTLNSITITGSSDVFLHSIQSENLKINLTGSGDIIAKGKTNHLSITVSGSGDIDATELTARNATIDIRGSADVQITTKETLNVSISGSGDVTYFGNPQQINKRISGSGDLTSGD